MKRLVGDVLVWVLALGVGLPLCLLADAYELCTGTWRERYGYDEWPHSWRLLKTLCGFGE